MNVHHDLLWAALGADLDNGLFLLLDGAGEINLPGLIYEMEADPNLFHLYQETAYKEVMEVSPILVKASPGGGLMVLVS